MTPAARLLLAVALLTGGGGGGERAAGDRPLPEIEPPSTTTASQKLGIHHRSVWRILDEADVDRRPVGPRARRLRKADLVRLYVREGLSLVEVAGRLDVNADVVKRNLDRLGIPGRDRCAPLDRRVLKELYGKQRLGIRAVAARLGVSPTTVERDLVAFAIPIRRPGRPAAT